VQAGRRRPRVITSSKLLTLGGRGLFAAGRKARITSIVQLLRSTGVADKRKMGRREPIMARVWLSFWKLVRSLPRDHRGFATATRSRASFMQPVDGPTGRADKLMLGPPAISGAGDLLSWSLRTVGRVTLGKPLKEQFTGASVVCASRR